MSLFNVNLDIGLIYLINKKAKDWLYSLKIVLSLYALKFPIKYHMSQKTKADIVSYCLKKALKNINNAMNSNERIADFDPFYNYSHKLNEIQVETLDLIKSIDIDRQTIIERQNGKCIRNF